jgi:hypothetical protein
MAFLTLMPLLLLSSFRTNGLLDIAATPTPLLLIFACHHYTPLLRRQLLHMWLLLLLSPLDPLSVPLPLLLALILLHQLLHLSLLTTTACLALCLLILDLLLLALCSWLSVCHPIPPSTLCPTP